MIRRANYQGQKRRVSIKSWRRLPGRTNRCRTWRKIELLLGKPTLVSFFWFVHQEKWKCICKLAQLAIARLKIFKDLKGFSGRTIARLLIIVYLSPQSSYYEGVGKIGHKRKDAKEVFLPASPEVKDDEGDGGDVEGTSNDSHRKWKVFKTP